MKLRFLSTAVAALLLSRAEASVLPQGLEDMGDRMRGTFERLQAGRSAARQEPGMASACADHFVSAKDGTRERASSILFVKEMEQALAQTSRMKKEQAGLLVQDLRASGAAPEHLGWAILLTVRSQGLQPTEAVYCHNPQAPEGLPKKWIGVATAEGRRFLLDLDPVAETGTGLNLTALQGDKVVASATGGGAESLLSGGDRDGGLAGRVLKAVQGASFDSWFDGAAARSGAASAPASGSRGSASKAADDLPWVLPWRGRVSGEVPPPSRMDPSVFEEKSGASASPFLSALSAAGKKAYGAAFPVLSRLDWGARAFRGSPTAMTPSRITIHHTAGSRTMSRDSTVREVRGIQEFHQKGRGWGDIGYHFLIDGQGRVVEGRPIGTLGAHVQDENSGNIGISLMGDFNSEKPTEAQVESLRRLVAFLSVTYAMDPLSALYTHRVLNDTDCPGRYVVGMLDSLKRQMSRKADELAQRYGIGRSVAHS